jgi:hypothetical protein
MQLLKKAENQQHLFFYRIDGGNKNNFVDTINCIKQKLCQSQHICCCWVSSSFFLYFTLIFFKNKMLSAPFVLVCFCIRAVIYNQKKKSLIQKKGADSIILFGFSSVITLLMIPLVFITALHLEFNNTPAIT